MERKKNKGTWRWTIIADSGWQETDPTSRQRGRPTETREQISDRINIWSQVPQDTETYWLNASRNVTSASRK
jgi:hypothetical protein